MNFNKGQDPELDRYLNEIYQEGINKGLEMGIKKGISRGIALEKENFDKQFTLATGKLIQAGVDYQVISDSTGFSIEDLKEIEADLNL
ncbi:hypothetical protein [Spirochaeta isovalerica]|uniref:Transposase n=1 Tax=Spirochaeta isovalerica TaxID=150 RepID=A0A841R120_9SPIO|nr:hypothetical protein [Spirochaeta isovalerica]MBB6478654.1 hypothetical protein [Spirochaeta isovalerica]